MVTNFKAKIGEIGRLTFIRCLPWHSKTECDIAIPISKSSSAMTGYIVKKFGELRSSNSGV